MKWAVLLTSCVRTTNPGDEKRIYYLRAIKDWLEKTTLPIFIVESSGYTFPEFKNTRLNVCSFDLSEKLASSSQYEARSILYAMDYFKNELEPYTHILKVTARYYVDIEQILQSVPDVDIILQSQHNHSVKSNNSELFGFRKENYTFLNKIVDIGLMECTIYDFAASHSYHRLDPIENIYKVKRGGDNLIVHPL